MPRGGGGLGDGETVPAEALDVELDGFLNAAHGFGEGRACDTPECSGRKIVPRLPGTVARLLGGAPHDGSGDPPYKGDNW
jgi:hypothetical protein